MLRTTLCFIFCLLAAVIVWKRTIPPRAVPSEVLSPKCELPFACGSQALIHHPSDLKPSAVTASVSQIKSSTHSGCSGTLASEVTRRKEADPRADAIRKMSPSQLICGARTGSSASNIRASTLYRKCFMWIVSILEVGGVIINVIWYSKRIYYKWSKNHCFSYFYSFTGHIYHEKIRQFSCLPLFQISSPPD